MTKITVIGEENQYKNLKKPIELCYLINSFKGETMSLAAQSPLEFQNIELISKGYLPTMDLIFCYNQDRSMGMAYFGRWNDGVV